VMGDLEGKTYAVSLEPGKFGEHHYHVLRSIPEHLIVVYQPIPPEGQGPAGLPGLGCAGVVSPGFHVILLSEHEGKTTFTTYMDHSSLMTRNPDTMTDEEALKPWRGPGFAPEWHRKWRDDFFPELKRLAH